MKNLERGLKFLDDSSNKQNNSFFDVKEHSTLESRRLDICAEFQPPAYVIDGIIPDGVGVIAGSAGIGKTTGIIPLAAIAAGFSSHLSDIKAKRKDNKDALTIAK